MTGHRILVMAHGHPDLRRGGGEIAALNLFQAYQQHADVNAAWFLAATNRGNGASGRINRHRTAEYLWDQQLADSFWMKAANRAEVSGYFAELLEKLKPTIVHTHHYSQFGLEYLRVIKQIDPSIRTVLTLHEYMAICPNQGLMLDPKSQERCRSGFYEAHQHCAPGRSAEDLWLRKHRFERYFDHVDHFVAPSEFLRQRYIEWGLAPERISLIENGQPQTAPEQPREIVEGGARNRFGYFGQINPYKGLDVLLAGLSALPGKKRRQLRLEMHGANLELQSREFRQRISAIADPLIAEGVVQDCGPYDPSELAGRMRRVDWVMVPSIWFENSPLVIQEAFAHGRPVIASNIGGMAEKVIDGVNGLTLPPGNCAHWAETMERVAGDMGLWERLRDGLPVPLSVDASAAQHLEMFNQVKAGVI